MLTTTELNFRYAPPGGFELRVPPLALAAGDTMAIVGPSGCGKSTLLSILAGERRPTSGTVRFGDQAISELPDADRRAFRITKVGLVFQEFRLVEYLDVLDNILLPCRLHPALALDASMRSRAIALAERLGIAPHLHRLPERLSHGERQRAAVARALVTNPRLLLADEPTGNLDPLGKQRLLSEVLAMARDTGAIVILATHDHALLPSFGRTLDFTRFEPAVTDGRA